MFGLYDGHGGEGCCNFLKDNLHSFIFNQLKQDKLENSISKSCRNADNSFNSLIEKGNFKDKSGSCATGLLMIGKYLFFELLYSKLTLFLDEKLVFINIGDSRSIVLRNDLNDVHACTTDHKPRNIEEMNRVFTKGGYLYRVKIDECTQETVSYRAYSIPEVIEVEN